LSGAGEGIGIEESSQFRIVITGLEVIQFGLCGGILAMRFHGYMGNNRILEMISP
jgi:hypothetical protein